MSSTKRLLDAYDGIVETFHFDPDTGGFAIETRQDCSDIVAEAKAMGELPNPRDPDMHHVAKIPQYVLDQAIRDGWYHDAKAWKRWANDPDNKAFRVPVRGRVTRL